MRNLTYFFSTLFLLGLTTLQANPDWVIETQSDWEQQTQSQTGLTYNDGFAELNDQTGTFTSKIKSFSKKTRAENIVFEQSPVWQNWEPISNLGPSNLQDAPVLLSMGPDNYWMFGRYGSGVKKKKNKKSKKGGVIQKAALTPEFTPQPAKLEGFDIELMTTRYPNQYDAPGAKEKGLGGYHAWQSKDMVNWVHHGPVTEGFSRWVTTAEYVDGKVYIYYDYPNDQDPHLYIDDNLFDGKPGKNMGLAFADPSHGSDCSFIRDKAGNFHVIYEDWSPISANKRSWDSPLAGHAMSKDGIKDFKILAPAVDNRTKPTGEIGTYKHPHWLQHPDFTTNIAEYNIHSPEQEAYGDWASICIGEQYYLFGDYDPVGGHAMSTCWFTSNSLDKTFSWCDHIGNGHPDPDICFAEGRFYLATQQSTDYVSDGPWVEKVEVRVGVDIDNDQKIDQWSDWGIVSESYDYTPGFAKQVQRKAASMNLTQLPEGYGFQFEFKLSDTTENKSKPILDKVRLNFN